MFSSLKKIFGAQPERPSITMSAGKLFQWRRGLRLEAATDSQLAFPGELVHDDEQMGSIIEADDEAEMGFQKRADGSFEAIHLRLRAGHAVTLHRSSDVLLVAPDGQQRVFYVLSSTSGAG